MACVPAPAARGASPENSRAPALERLFVEAGCAGKIAIHLIPRDAAARYLNGEAKRGSDFAAGRTAALRCLRTLGHPARAIGRGPGREPLWPDGFSGSITHTAGLAGAAVCGISDRVLSLGIDAEQLGGIGEADYETVFTAEELGFLARLSPTDRAFAATSLFSAKEALFKAQFPLTRAFVDFQDVSIGLDSPITGIEGTLKLQHGVAVLEQYCFALFHRLVGDHIVTGAVAQAAAK